MIWFTLALFVVSFIITALLAPKPEFENARAGSLDDVQFPRATENAPMPLVLGRIRMKGPNTLWYGDYEAVPIVERVKTGLFSKKNVIVGHRYFIGLHLGLCLGPNVDLVEIYLDEEIVWSGDTAGAATTNISINKPSLFGGHKSGGGWVSNGLFYNGNFNQTPDSYLEGVVGVGDVPAYNGMSHIVFNKAEIGEQNNLRPFAFVLESYTDDLNLPDNGTVNGGLDMNPMEAMYQIMVDKWRGLGVSPADIDVTSFVTAGVVLHGEGNGVSVAVSSESDGKKVIAEILRQIDGIMIQDPESGQIQVKLVREDYDVGLIPVLDEDSIVNVKSFTRTTWDEVRAQVKVMYPQRDRDSERVAISQDMAVVQTTGKLLTNAMSFPFCYDTTLATNIASRERAQVSVPLFRATLQLNRTANELRPGDPFIFSWAKYGINQLVMRVQRFDLGELMDGRIVVEAIQDAFAVSDTVFASQPPSSWNEVITTPTDIAVARIVEMPAFFTEKLETPMLSGVPGFVPVALRSGSGSTGYQVAAFHGPAGEVEADAIYDWPYVPYQGSGLLTAAYDRLEGFVTGKDTITGLILNSVEGLFVNNTTADITDDFDGLILINDEWMAFEVAVDNGLGSWTLTNVYRGLFGSQIATHAIGSRVYSVPVEAFGDGLYDEGVLTELSDFRLMDMAGGTTQDITEGLNTTAGPGLAANNALPVRPGDVQMNGSRALGQIVADNVDRNLTWAPRQHSPDNVTLETGASETPDQNERYDITVRVDGITNGPLSGSVGVGITTYAIPFSLSSINSNDVEIRVTPVYDTGAVSGEAFSFLPIQVQQFLAGTPLVITNFDAETGDTTGWTNVTGGMAVRSASPSPYEGSFYFFGGANAFTEEYQDVAVPVAEETNVDAGTAVLNLQWRQSSFAADDQANVKVEFFDIGMGSLGTNAGPGLLATTASIWTLRNIFGLSVPVNTRFVRIILEFNRTAGGNNDGYIDFIEGAID